MDEDQIAEVQRNIGIAFQSGGLFNSMSVGDNVAMPIREYGKVDEDLVMALVRLKLSMVGLGAAEDLMPGELSGGMRKRAGLARAIALDPPVIYFDEPSAGLDPIIASGLDDLILNLNKLLGITFIIVTHELDSIRKISHRILMLDKGKAIFLGTLDEAMDSGVSRVKQFFERRPDEQMAQQGR
jgi:phospholipid/cholesterol/gamma-HCH transport system ATP-binding protein